MGDRGHRLTITNENVSPPKAPGSRHGRDSGNPCHGSGEHLRRSSGSPDRGVGSGRTQTRETELRGFSRGLATSTGWTLRRKWLNSGYGRERMLDLSELPDGWRVVRLEDVAHVNPRRPKLQVRADLPTSFIPMAAVRENCQGINAFETRPYHEIAKGYTYFESNDVLFAKITPCLQNGKHALAADLTNGFGFGTTEFHVVRPGVELDPKHIYRVLTQPRNISKCINSFTGTAGQQRVQPDVLRSLIVLLPPLSEQRAIAAVLDAIDEAIDRTGAIVNAAERLRDAVLHELLTRGVPGWHSRWRHVPNMGTVPTDWKVERLGSHIADGPTNGIYKPESAYGKGGLGHTDRRFSFRTLL